MNGRRWSEDEDIYLEYFIYQGDDKMKIAAEYLNRSWGATCARATYLRKNNKNKFYLKKRWTTKEDNILKNEYCRKTVNELATNLGRTEESVKSRCKFLKLKKTRPVTRRKKEIISLVGQGYYRKEIAKELNIDEKSLSTFLRLNGIYCKQVPYSERTKKMKVVEGGFIAGKQRN